LIKSVAIGSFDGVHIGHQELIKRADGVVVIERGFATLTPGWKRSIYTKKPTYFYLLESIKNLTPQEFIKKLESDFPALERIVVGYDFAFGKGKSGSIATLKEHFRGEVVVVDEVKYEGISVHSRIIREHLLYGDIALANAMLGRNYRVDGRQIRGLGLGSKELFSTINLDIKNYTLPLGVFACYIYIRGVSYRGAAFIGNRVSVDNSFSVEVHILDEFQADFLEFETIWLEFVAFIREIKSFDSLQALKSAIKSDIENINGILKRRN